MSKIKPLRVSLDKMKLFEVRDEMRKQGISPLEEGLRRTLIVDPTLRKTAEMLREFHC